MMPNILLRFESTDDVTKFIETAKKSSAKIIRDSVKRDDYKINVSTLENSVRVVSLYVGGKKTATGIYEDIKIRFDQETATHSGSVQMREMRDGKDTVIKSRAKRVMY